MYVGRIVAVARNKAGHTVAMYRVSSRSYPNRQAKQIGQNIAVVPRQGFESDIHKNPYIAYHCLRLAGDFAVVDNGTHTDPITEKLASGMRMRDAMVTSLSGLDYEHDDYCTPRIAGIVDRKSGRSALGTIRRDALLVQEYDLQMGQGLYVATYEHDTPGRSVSDGEFDVASAEEACRYVLGEGVFADLERPILAACALEAEAGFAVAYRDADPRAR